MLTLLSTTSPSRPNLFAAWKSDVERIRAKLAPSHQSALSYIIADEPQGLSETFAEIVAAFMGGGCLAYYANNLGRTSCTRPVMLLRATPPTKPAY